MERRRTAGRSVRGSWKNEIRPVLARYLCATIYRSPAGNNFKVTINGSRSRRGDAIPPYGASMLFYCLSIELPMKAVALFITPAIEPESHSAAILGCTESGTEGWRESLVNSGD